MQRDDKERIVSESFRKGTTGSIYETLRQSIMNLELYPGSRVTETELAQHFGVSRTPVREALQRLAVEGYLTIRPKHGMDWCIWSSWCGSWCSSGRSG